MNYRYNSLEDFLATNPLSVDAQVDDGWGAVFPVKGREIEAAILFSDITGFCRRTLDLSPTETLIFVNNFFAWISADAEAARSSRSAAVGVSSLHLDKSKARMGLAVQGDVMKTLEERLSELKVKYTKGVPRPGIERTYEGLDSCHLEDDCIVYITSEEGFIVPEGTKGTVLWQGKEVKIRSLGGVASKAAQGRRVIWTVRLQVLE